MLGGQAFVLGEQGGAAAGPARGAVGVGAAVADGLQPVDEDPVGEGVPHGQGLLLGPGAAGGRVAGGAFGQGLARVADALAEDRAGGQVLAGRRAGGEAQGVGEGFDGGEQVQGGLGVAVAQQPGGGERYGLFWQVQFVLAAVEEGVEVGQAPLGEVVGVEGGALFGQAAAAGEFALVGAQGAARGGQAGGEAAVDDLGGDPGGQVLDGGAGADGEGAVPHAGDDPFPGVDACARGLADAGVLVGEGGGEFLGQPSGGVAPVGVRGVVSSMPAWRDLPPHPPGPKPGALTV